MRSTGHRVQNERPWRWSNPRGPGSPAQLPLLVLDVHTRKSSLLTLPPAGWFYGLKMLLPCFLFCDASPCWPEKQPHFIIPPAPRKTSPNPKLLVKFFLSVLPRVSDSAMLLSLCLPSSKGLCSLTSSSMQSFPLLPRIMIPFSKCCWRSGAQDYTASQKAEHIFSATSASLARHFQE